MKFEWDPEKAQSNFRKHGVMFEDAIEAFSDPWGIAIEDVTSHGERRYNQIGMVAERLLNVTFTWRDDVCRVISARGTTRYERRLYHEALDRH